jgi:hypothetical protein
MPVPASADAAPPPPSPATVVDACLRLPTTPDPAAARRCVAPELRIRFTGGRAMQDPSQCATFDAGRHCWVKRRVERTEAVACSPAAH